MSQQEITIFLQSIEFQEELTELGESIGLQDTSSPEGRLALRRLEIERRNLFEEFLGGKR